MRPGTASGTPAGRTFAPGDGVRGSETIRVFDYTDYRKYLDDYYRDQKRQSKAFSYRFFARKVGIRSVGLYKDVVEGRQSLGQSLIVKFSAALGLGDREREYFRDMVCFGEARSAEERKLYFRRMMASAESKASRLDAAQYEYYSKWYYSAAWALFACTPLGDTEADCRKLARLLEPPIRIHQAKKAVEVLKSLGLVVPDARGYLRPSDPVITSGTRRTERNLQTLNVINFQKGVLGLAMDAYDRHPLEDLDMSTLTLTLSRETFQAVKKEMAELRRKISNLAAHDEGADRVYQLSYNLFPVSRGHAEG